jgi:hypothetical protein
VADLHKLKSSGFKVQGSKFQSSEFSVKRFSFLVQCVVFKSSQNFYQLPTQHQETSPVKYGQCVGFALFHRANTQQLIADSQKLANWAEIITTQRYSIND